MKLAIILVLLSSQTEHFTLRGTKGKIEQMDLPTCHAKKRLEKDRYEVALGPDGAAVNGTPWTTRERSEEGVLLSHRASEDAFTSLEMTIHKNGTGSITLIGRDENREPCADRVKLISVH